MKKEPEPNKKSDEKEVESESLKQLNAETYGPSDDLEKQVEVRIEENKTKTLDEKALVSAPLADSDVVLNAHLPLESLDKQVVGDLDVEGGLKVSKSEDELASCGSPVKTEPEK